jgi:sugar/nucleoside kinase (ribokinase family)
MKILGVGESVIDRAYIIDKKIEEKHIGGPSLIAMILLARLGVESTLLTTVGRDEEAGIIRKKLKHEGVHMLAKIQKHTKVNKYRINPINGSREKIRGDVIHPPIKSIDRNFIRQFDVIIIDRHEPVAFSEIIKKKRATTKIIIDPSTEVSDLTLAMIQYADYPIIPIEALIKIGNSNNLSICLEKVYLLAKKTIVITAGELGSIIYNGKQCELIPTLRVNAIDVQGAGDIYRGAFAYGILQEWGIKESVSYANKVAALHCTKLGNAAAVPTKKEIDAFSISLNAKELNVETIANYNRAII